MVIISIYRPPSATLGWKRWSRFIADLEEIAGRYAIIVCGDLNVQHFTWDSSRPNLVGVRLADSLASSPLIILNNGSSTRISANQNHISSPDVTIVSPDMAGLIRWEVMEYSMDNDG